jgi:hypothetical protein
MRAMAFRREMQGCPRIVGVGDDVVGLKPRIAHDVAVLVWFEASIFDRGSWASPKWRIVKRLVSGDVPAWRTARPNTQDSFIFATCNRADGVQQSVTEIQNYCSWAAPRSLTQAEDTMICGTARLACCSSRAEGSSKATVQPLVICLVIR